MNSVEIEAALNKLQRALSKTELSHASRELQSAADKITTQLPGSPLLKVEEFLPVIRTCSARLEHHVVSLNNCVAALKQVVDSFTQ